MQNPMNQIRKDLTRLGQLTIDAGIQLTSEMQIKNERTVRSILKKYAMKKRKSPVYRAT